MSNLIKRLFIVPFLVSTLLSSSIVAHAQTNPSEKEAILNGGQFKVVLNDERLKEMPINELELFISNISKKALQNRSQPGINFQTISYDTIQIEISDSDLKNLSPNSLQEMLLALAQDSMSRTRASVEIDVDTDHTCGQTRVKFGGMNYVYYSDGSLAYRFQLAICIVPSCPYDATYTYY